MDQAQAGGLELTVSKASDEIDRVILSLADERWQKVAMIVAKSEEILGEMNDDGLNRVGDRVAALVEAGRLEAQGDVSRWRHSEVRQPQ